MILRNRLNFLWLLGCAVCVGTVSHERNLIWAQKDINFSGVARIVGVDGDPNNWVVNRTATTRYITAPNNHWHFVALNYLYSQRTLFWSDRGNKKIQGLQLGGSNVAFSVFGGISSQVEGLSVDWLAETIYWTDALYNWIIVAPAAKHSSMYRIIIDTGLDKPMGIAVYPHKGYLFWSDCGNVPKIEKSSLSGEDRLTLVSRNILKPMGVAIDYKDNRIYWVDRKKDTVESVDLHGENRKTLFTVPNTKFFDLTLFQDFIFITDQEEGQLYVFNRRLMKHEVNFSLGTNPYGIVMYDSSLQENLPQPCKTLGCKHMCVSHYRGEARCLCTTGYELLPDGRTCVEDGRYSTPLFIYSIGAALCRFPGNLADMSLQNISLDTQCFLTHRRNALALSFNIYEQMLYFAENKSRTISRVHLHEGQSPEVVVGGTGHVEGLAVDWLSANMYWTDMTYKQIWVSRTNGRHQKILIASGLEKPHGIAVDPLGRYVYWTDIGVSARIERANLDGTRRLIMINTDLGSPNHIAIDYKSKRLFWSDSQKDRIESMRMDGTDRTVIMKQTGSSAYGLAVFQDFLVWTDRDRRNGIHVGLKDTGEKIRGIVHPGIGIANDVITYDYSVQPLSESACDDMNGGCEQLCLPEHSRYRATCSCALGLKMGRLSKRCEADVVRDNFLLFTDTYQKQIYQMNLKNFNISAIPLSSHDNPIAVDYHPFEEKIYWTDVASKRIKKAFLNGSSEETVLNLSNTSIPDGIALDVNSNLIYYTDTGENHIAVVSMSGIYHKVLIRENLDQPRAIVLDPGKGLMFWTDWGSNSRIERAHMDGEARTAIVTSSIGWPNGLDIDTTEGMLYWCDAKSDKIETSDLQGKNRRVLKSEPGAHFFGLTVLDRYLFYTDWTKRSVRRMLKSNGLFNIDVGPAVFSRINDIHSYSSAVYKREQRMNECMNNNAGCSHLCLPVPNGHVCKCPDVVHTSLRSVHRPCSVKKIDVVSEVKLEAPLGSSSTKINRSSTTPSVTENQSTVPVFSSDVAETATRKLYQTTFEIHGTVTHPTTVTSSIRPNSDSVVTFPESTNTFFSRRLTTKTSLDISTSANTLFSSTTKNPPTTRKYSTLNVQPARGNDFTRLPKFGPAITYAPTTSLKTRSTQSTMTIPTLTPHMKSSVSASTHAFSTWTTRRGDAISRIKPDPSFPIEQTNIHRDNSSIPKISVSSSTQSHISLNWNSMPPRRSKSTTLASKQTSRHSTLVTQGTTKTTTTTTTTITTTTTTRSTATSTRDRPLGNTIWIFAKNDVKPSSTASSSVTKPPRSSLPSSTITPVSSIPDTDQSQEYNKKLIGIPLYALIGIVAGSVLIIALIVVAGVLFYKKATVSPARRRSVTIEHSTANHHQRSSWNDSFEIPLQDTLSPANRTNSCTNYITFHDNYYTGDVDSGIENPAFVQRDHHQEQERQCNGFLAGKQFSTFRHTTPISPC